MNTEGSASGGDRQFLATQQYVPATPGVLLLFQGRCPSTIPWLVVAAVIAALDRMLWRWLASHVGKEEDKALLPPRADAYATTTVVLIGRAVRVRTPRLHLFPRSIFSRGTFPDIGIACLAVGLGALRCEFISPASATGGSAGAQIRLDKRLLGTAVTAAKERPVAAFARERAQDNQPAESGALLEGGHSTVTPGRPAGPRRSGRLPYCARRLRARLGRFPSRLRPGASRRCPRYGPPTTCGGRGG